MIRIPSIKWFDPLVTDTIILPKGNLSKCKLIEDFDLNRLCSAELNKC